MEYYDWTEEEAEWFLDLTRIVVSALHTDQWKHHKFVYDLF